MFQAEIRSHMSTPGAPLSQLFHHIKGYLITALLIGTRSHSWGLGTAETLLGVTVQRKDKEAFDVVRTHAVKAIRSDPSGGVP
jgi:hypothetical protein